MSFKGPACCPDAKRKLSEVEGQGLPRICLRLENSLNTKASPDHNRPEPTGGTAPNMPETEPTPSVGASRITYSYSSVYFERTSNNDTGTSTGALSLSLSLSLSFLYIEMYIHLCISQIVRTCMYMCIYMYVYIYTYIYMYVYIYIHVYVQILLHIYT